MDFEKVAFRVKVCYEDNGRKAAFAILLSSYFDSALLSCFDPAIPVAHREGGLRDR